MLEPKTMPIGIRGVPFMAVSTQTITFRGRTSEAVDGHASVQGEIWKSCVVHFQIKVRSRAARAAQVG